MTKYKSYKDQYPKGRPFSASTIISQNTYLPVTYSDQIAMYDTGESLDERFNDNVKFEKPENGNDGYLYVVKDQIDQTRGNAYVWDGSKYIQISNSSDTTQQQGVSFDTLENRVYDINVNDNATLSVTNVPQKSASASVYILNTNADKSIVITVPVQLAGKTCKRNAVTFDIAPSCVVAVEIRYSPSLGGGMFIVNVGSNLS